MLLITAVSLVSPANASLTYSSAFNNQTSKKNTVTVFRQKDSLKSTITGTASIMFTADGKPAFNNTNPKPLTISFTFASSQSGNVFVPQPSIVKTDVPANGANVIIQLTQGNVVTTCKNNVGSTVPNTPVQIGCRISNGATVTVIVTTNV